MSYEHSSKSGQAEEAQARSEDEAPRRVAPGKRTRTAALPPRMGCAPAVQLQRGPAVAPAREVDAGLTAQWLNAAVRPDLFSLPVQRKVGGGAEIADVPELGELPAASGGGQAMPEAVRAKMERALGADFSAVRIHEGPRAEALGALAYAQGTDIHFAPGQYRPDDVRGQELLGHELQHVVQQAQGRARPTVQAKGVAIDDDPALEREADEMGARAARGEAASAAAGPVAAGPVAGGPARAPSGGPVQRQRRQAIDGAGNFLVSNDNTLAIGATAPTKVLYAKASKIAGINVPDSPLRFSALAETLTVPKSGETPEKVLSRVQVRNLENNTVGDDMQITDDCGRAAEKVIGHHHAHETLNAKVELGGWNQEYETTLTRITKLEVLLDVWVKHGLMNPVAVPKTRAYIDQMKGLLAQQKKEEAEELAKKIDTVMTGHYNKIKGSTPEKVEQAEKAAGINRFADVLPGQAFVILSSNDKHPRAAQHGLGTWVYHWAGVILAGEGGDTVALEILANAGPKNWFYDMYSAGTDQSFHDKHAATLQHGTTPFTLAMKRSDDKTVAAASEIGAATGVVTAIGAVVQVAVKIKGVASQRAGIQLSDGSVLLLTGNWAGLGAVAGRRGAARGELDSVQVDAKGNDWHPVPEPEISSIEFEELTAELALLTPEHGSDSTTQDEAQPPPSQPVIELTLLPDWSRFERFD